MAPPPTNNNNNHHDDDDDNDQQAQQRRRTASAEYFMSSSSSVSSFSSISTSTSSSHVIRPSPSLPPPRTGNAGYYGSADPDMMTAAAASAAAAAAGGGGGGGGNGGAAWRRRTPYSRAASSAADAGGSSNGRTPPVTNAGRQRPPVTTRSSLSPGFAPPPAAPTRASSDVPPSSLHRSTSVPSSAAMHSLSGRRQSLTQQTMTTNPAGSSIEEIDNISGGSGGVGLKQRSFGHAASFASFAPYQRRDMSSSHGLGRGSSDIISSSGAAEAAPGAGFSGRSTTITTRRSAPPQVLRRDVPASESGRKLDDEAKLTLPTTFFGRILFTIQLVFRNFFYGSPTSKDFSSLTSTALASRLVLILCTITALYIPTLYETVNIPPKWEYQPNRQLNGRDCVFNLYIEKQKPDEFNPDYVELKPKKDSAGNIMKPRKKDLIQPPPTFVNGTHRTKGQMKIAGRFIEAVASSFRSNLTLSQHLIFTNVRDGGLLAEKALLHWPLRGTYPTQLHIVAADKFHGRDKEDGGKKEDVLGYGLLNDIEERFRRNSRAGTRSRVHIYDRNGLAGLPNDDDEAESMDLPEGDFGRGDDDDDAGMGADDDDRWNNETSSAVELFTKRGRKRRLKSKKIKPYPDPRHFFPEEEDNSYVPYLHIDGEYFDDQLEILERIVPLLEENIVVAVGVEHSPDLDVYELIDFFHTVNYKTFFLGSRQIHRLDHLCPEMLEDILSHPSVNKHPPLPRIEHLFDQAWKTMTRQDQSMSWRMDEPPPPRQVLPPFFVAMPRGRLQGEEMTIQHMYDLFGGYGGGGGQIKTANDRKMPGK